MKRTIPTRAWISAGCVLLLGWQALAQETPPAQKESADENRQTTDTTPPQAPKTPTGPKYLNLRYDEDFSYLDDGPGTYRENFFDPIKNLHFGDDWTLNLGGEFRIRLEAETNKAFGANRRTQDTFVLHRYVLHADLKYGDVFRIFMQGIAAFDDDRNLARRGIDENRWDLQQVFFDVKVLGAENPLTLRFGRQDLQYGKQRFVSPLDWANTRRRFDAIKLFSHGALWDIDAFYAKPVAVQRDQRDRFDEEYDFYGLYVTYKGIPGHGIDGFFFAQDRTADRRNPNGRRGDESRYTLGTRFWGGTAGFDYQAMLAGQWGHWAGDTICAWAWTLDGGYTLADVAWKPRIGMGIDWADGDGSPLDRKVGTFDQLFPLGHAYLGYLDLIGRQNVNAARIDLSAWPVSEKANTTLAYHVFCLNEERDALYNAGGGAGRRNPFGKSGKEIGQELDFTLLWKLDAHSSVLLGYSHFWDSNFITSTGPSDDPDLIYIQYSYKF